MSLKFGDLELQIVSGGRLRIDGGNMFGVVPKLLWLRRCEPDDQNRIAMDCNCLLISSPKGKTLIDTGYGSKGSDRQKRNHSLEEGNPIIDNLAAIGVAPEEITCVIFSHLHFDHAGGATVRDENGDLRPAFTNARHIVQKDEWNDANANLPELAGAYFPDDFKPIEHAGLLELVDGDTEMLSGISLKVTGGHTRGHQIVLIESGGQCAAFLADLCPLAVHLPTMWSMAYDQDPLKVRRTKPAILGQAADNDSLLIFEHDPEIRAARIQRDEKNGFTVRETVAI